MEWYKSKILKKLFLETTKWNVAWKNINDQEYKIIKNPKGYWLADSLLFSTEEKCFLFVEAYDETSKLGKIGILEFNNNGFNNFKIIIEEKFHLSYPYVFEYKNEYYMIPESSEDNSIYLYKANCFPYKWERIKKIASGKFVDTTVIQENGSTFLVYFYDMANHFAITGTLDMEKKEINIAENHSDKSYTKRAGGNVFIKKSDMYHAIQNNRYFYGQSLSIVNFKSGKVEYVIKPEDLKVDNNQKYRRVHTYSVSNEIEAIDLSNYRFNLFKFLKKWR